VGFTAVRKEADSPRGAGALFVRLYGQVFVAGEKVGVPGRLSPRRSASWAPPGRRSWSGPRTWRDIAVAVRGVECTARPWSRPSSAMAFPLCVRSPLCCKSPCRFFVFRLDAVAGGVGYEERFACFKRDWRVSNRECDTPGKYCIIGPCAAALVREFRCTPKAMTRLRRGEHRRLAALTLSASASWAHLTGCGRAARRAATVTATRSPGGTSCGASTLPRNLENRAAAPLGRGVGLAASTAALEIGGRLEQIVGCCGHGDDFEEFGRSTS
jgi:hypothetical protein